MFNIFLEQDLCSGRNRIKCIEFYQVLNIFLEQGFYSVLTELFPGYGFIYYYCPNLSRSGFYYLAQLRETYSLGADMVGLFYYLAQFRETYTSGAELVGLFIIWPSSVGLTFPKLTWSSFLLSAAPWDLQFGF